jgi:hypothetical protein
MKTIEWVCTAANPQLANPSGWKLHAIEASPKETTLQLRGRRSKCGLTPRKGWEVDLFVVDKCARCLKGFR